jgi:hypothetical protein
MFGYLDAAPLALATQNFGTLQISPLALQEIRGLQEKESADDPSRLEVPSMLLAGENVLIARVDLPALHFVTAGQTIAVPPNQIRKLRATGEAGGHSDEVAVEAELRDGGKIVGTLAESVLPVRCGQGPRAIPVRDLVEIHVPSPSVSESTRNKIAELVRDLGASEYGKRKAVATSLRELGPLARPQLSEVMQQTSDPEVRRAAQALSEESSP